MGSLRARALLVAGLTAATCLSVAPPAEAASPIQFGRIQYDSPGKDTRSNTSLNAEYVILKNTSTTTRSLTGWTVRDATGYVYKFGSFSLRGGKSVVLRTGKGTNTSTTRYWGRASYVWNNTGDRAYLRNASGTIMDTCTWTSAGAGYKNC